MQTDAIGGIPNAINTSQRKQMKYHRKLLWTNKNSVEQSTKRDSLSLCMITDNDNDNDNWQW